MDVPSRAVGARTYVEHEKGRWVVYMEVTEWMDDAAPGANPTRIRTIRIEEYPTQARAQVAARWMERTADRTPDVRWMRSL